MSIHGIFVMIVGFVDVRVVLFCVVNNGLNGNCWRLLLRNWKKDVGALNSALCCG
jgi:hypothetical protein